MVTLPRLAWRGLQAVLWIVLLGFLVLIGLSRVTPFEVLVVRSGSMQPAISTGGIVIVDRGAHSPPILAIASFREPDGSIVTHRVVGMDGSRFITRGDANDANDSVHRPIASVYGTVVLSLPFVGYLIHLLQQPVVFLALLVGTGGFLIADALRTIVNELARMRRDRRIQDVE
jgi:signal peptidase